MGRRKKEIEYSTMPSISLEKAIMDIELICKTKMRKTIENCYLDFRRGEIVGEKAMAIEILKIIQLTKMEKSNE